MRLLQDGTTERNASSWMGELNLENVLPSCTIITLLSRGSRCTCYKTQLRIKKTELCAEPQIRSAGEFCDANRRGKIPSFEIPGDLLTFSKKKMQNLLLRKTTSRGLIIYSGFARESRKTSLRETQERVFALWRRRKPRRGKGFFHDPFDPLNSPRISDRVLLKTKTNLRKCQALKMRNEKPNPTAESLLREAEAKERQFADCGRSANARHETRCRISSSGKQHRAN